MAEERYGAPVYAVHRVDLHNELLHLAFSQDTTDSKPVILRLGAQVVDASTDGSITLKDGSRHAADLVVAADGLHSVLRDIVVSHDTKPPYPSGLSSFRLMLDTHVFKDDAKLAQLLEARGQGVAIIIDAKEKISERHMVWYPCREWVTLNRTSDILMLNIATSGEVQNFAGIHPTRADPEEGKTSIFIRGHVFQSSSLFDCWGSSRHEGLHAQGVWPLPSRNCPNDFVCCNARRRTSGDLT